MTEVWLDKRTDQLYTINPSDKTPPVVGDIDDFLIMVPKHERGRDEAVELLRLIPPQAITDYLANGKEVFVK